MIKVVNCQTGEVTFRELTPEELAAIPVKTQEEIEKEARELFKIERQALVDNIKVTVADKVYDGDEVSQTRMSRAISVMQPGETTKWILADNSTYYPTKEELLEALRLAGAEQTRLWEYNPSEEEQVVEVITDGIN